MHKDISTSKVFYRPIEAAIRWAGLLRYLPMILATIASPRVLPRSLVSQKKYANGFQKVIAVKIIGCMESIIQK